MPLYCFIWTHLHNRTLLWNGFGPSCVENLACGKASGRCGRLKNPAVHPS
jgi:hypothetical protein